MSFMIVVSFEQQPHRFIPFLMETVDVIYNRITDFGLTQQPSLNQPFASTMVIVHAFLSFEEQF